MCVSELVGLLDTLEEADVCEVKVEEVQGCEDGAEQPDDWPDEPDDCNEP